MLTSIIHANFNKKYRKFQLNAVSSMNNKIENMSIFESWLFIVVSAYDGTCDVNKDEYKCLWINFEYIHFVSIRNSTVSLKESKYNDK